MNIVYKNALVRGKITDITVEKGKIVSLNKTSEEGIDLNCKKTFAGLIDIHTHGCLGLNVTDAIDELEKICKI